ncbi:MAG: M50 family metallopeptidase [Pseudomonadota bacterium]|nr:M50 family metallopeptidase [Pseudomonadota bacterium]
MTAANILVFLVMLSVLVVLHEYGHFIVARRNGVRVTDFAMGMGPTLLKWTSPRSGTNYRLNAFPIGGYCQMKGEDGQSSEAEQQRQFRDKRTYDADNFQAKTPLQRLAIVLAGPVASFVIALVLLFGAAMIFGVPGETPTTQVFQLVRGYPADRAGMHAGDRIVSIDGRAMSDGNVLIETIHRALGKKVRVVYSHAGHETAVDLTPVPTASDPKNGHLGFQPLPKMQAASIGDAWDWTQFQFRNVITGTFGVLGALFTHPQTVAGQVSGPIGMARAAATAQDFGPFMFLFFAAQISISLGIFNLLPIPALDGGRGIFILVEMLRGRPVDPEKEALVHVGGFAVLIALMLAVSYHDVAVAFTRAGT